MKSTTIKHQYNARRRRLISRGITYKEYLTSSWWKHIRVELKKDSRYKACHCCLSTENLHMHHMTYKYIFEERMSLQKQHIVALCSHCHQLVHDLSNIKGWGLRKCVKRLYQMFDNNRLIKFDGFIDANKQTILIRCRNARVKREYDG